MPQLSKQADEKLNELSRKIGSQKQIIDIAQHQHDDAWAEAIDILAEFGETRFIADDGHYLQLQSRENKPKLDEAALERVLRAHCQDQRISFEDIWDQITDRKVNAEKLEEFVMRGRIPASLLVECLQPVPPTPARAHPLWTAEDKNRAVVLGIKKG